jgi:D-tyrosyl-tRNA(Tyr) deacylase
VPPRSRPSQISRVRVILQRVSSASVSIGGDTVGVIDGPGFVLLVGFTHSDTPAEVSWMAEKVVGLRVFGDDEGKMNRSLADVRGGALVISQFTVYGDARKGRRPSFIDAARPEQAIPLYEAFIAALRAAGVPVATGRFGADMQVSLVNDGPVTLVLDRDAGGMPSA